MNKLEYDFETLELSAGGYSLFGVGIQLEGHREVILRRAQEGWRYRDFSIICRSPERYYGCLDAALRQRTTGHVEAIELVFCRETAQE